MNFLEQLGDKDTRHTLTWKETPLSKIIFR